MKKPKVRYAKVNSLPLAETPDRGLPIGQGAVEVVGGRPQQRDGKPRWTGVRRTPRADYARTSKWKRLADSVRANANHACEFCGQTLGQLQVDHIIPVRVGGATYDLMNLQLLCRSCHYRKGLEDKRKYPQLNYRH